MLGKEKQKSGVSKELLQKCAGSDLEKNRLAHVDSCSVEPIVIDSDGTETEAEKWLKSNKKKLNA